MLDEGEGLEVVRDAPSYRWGGNWRMMGYYELRAFLKAMQGTPTPVGDNIQITFNINDNGTPKTETVTYPKTSYVVGLQKESTYSSNEFLTWLRFSKPLIGAETAIEIPAALYWDSNYGDEVYEYTEQGNIQANDAVYLGYPILPVLVLPAQK